MKAFLSALVLLSVLAGAAAPAFADDWSPRDFWTQEQNTSP